MKITRETTLKEIQTAAPFSQARDQLIGGSNDFFTGEKSGQSLADLQKEHPAWHFRDIIYGLDRLQEVASQQSRYLYPAYSQEEVQSDPHLAQVQLFYLPAAQNPAAPCAILLAGGAYGSVCTMIESLPVAAKLNRMGITCFCLNYRTALPESFSSGLMPKPLDDLAAAWRFIQVNQEHFRVQAAHYWVAGFSAGGHTAALWGTPHLGYRSYGLPKPRMLLLAYPLLTMENQPPGKMTDYINLGLFGAGYTLTDIRRYAVHRHVDAEYPPVYLVHCLDDAVVPLKDSEDFQKALEEAGVKYQIERPATGGHGFGLGSAVHVRGWIERGVSFLQGNTGA